MTSAPNLTDKHDWTVDDVAKLPEDLQYELIDGRLISSPSAMPFHQWISWQIGNALHAHCPDDFLITFAQSVVVDHHNEPRPDVVVLKEEGANRTPVLSSDVLLAVEILSPESSTRDRRDKLKLYAYGGIPEYWIVDPLGERVTLLPLLLDADGTYRPRERVDGRVTIDRPWDVTLDLPAWTRRRDRLREVARPDT